MLLFQCEFFIGYHEKFPYITLYLCVSQNYVFHKSLSDSIVYGFIGNVHFLDWKNNDLGIWLIHTKYRCVKLSTIYLSIIYHLSAQKIILALGFKAFSLWNNFVTSEHSQSTLVQKCLI